MLVALAFTGCSSDKHVNSDPTGPSAGPAALPTSSAGAQGQQLLAAAITATRALRSYSFASVQTVGGTKPTRTTITGTSIRPTSLHYVLTAGGKRTEVIRVAGATYVRVLPAKWSKARKPVAVDSAVSLLNLLGNITQPSSAGSTSASATIRGIVPAASAVKAGLPMGSKDTVVVLALDASDHVVAVSFTTTVTRPGVKPIGIAVRTTYGMFNAVRVIKAPV